MQRFGDIGEIVTTQVSSRSFSRLRRDVQHLLYRCWDCNGQLVYIGVTNSYSQRMYHHRARTPWWRVVAKISTTPYPNRHTALKAETEAIEAERPTYNQCSRGTK